MGFGDEVFNGLIDDTLPSNTDFYSSNGDYQSYLRGVTGDTSFAGTDIKAIVNVTPYTSKRGNTVTNRVLANLHTITVSTYRESFPVRSIGQVSPKNYVKGPRCLPASEKVLVDKKGYISIADVTPGDRVQSSHNTYNRVIGSFNQGVKECNHLKLVNGYSLKASFDHPISTPKGWVKAGDLKPGDLVHVVGACPVSDTPMDISDDVLKLIAFLIGDGAIHSYKKKNSESIEYHISLSISDNEMSSIGKETAEMLNRNNINYRDYRKNEDRCISRIISVCVGPGATDWRQRVYNDLHKALLKFGLYNTYSHSKFIPQEFITSLNQRQICLFLNRLFATDGGYSIEKGNRGRVKASYASTSQELVDGIRILLKKVGIGMSKCREEKVGQVGGRPDIISCHDAYSLKTPCAFELVRFYKLIGIYGKDDKIAHLIPKLIASIKNKTIPIDTHFFCNIVKEIATSKSISFADINTTYGLYDYKRSLTPRRAIALANVLNDEKFSVFVNTLVDGLFTAIPELLNVRVIANNKIGKLQVYDLEVEDRHTFVASFVLVHNTVAGSMIFTTFDRQVLTELMDKPSNSKGAGSQEGRLRTEIGKEQMIFENQTMDPADLLIDQLPPFDITIICASELGQVSRAALYGVQVQTQGQVMSIQDIISETTVTYTARVYEPLKSLYNVFRLLTTGSQGDMQLRALQKTSFYLQQQYERGILSFKSYMDAVGELDAQVNTAIAARYAETTGRNTFQGIFSGAEGEGADVYQQMLAVSQNPFI